MKEKFTGLQLRSIVYICLDNPTNETTIVVLIATLKKNLTFIDRLVVDLINKSKTAMLNTVVKM